VSNIFAGHSLKNNQVANTLLPGKINLAGLGPQTVLNKNKLRQAPFITTLFGKCRASQSPATAYPCCRALSCLY